MQTLNCISSASRINNQSMKEPVFKHVYGPVPSRRLGRSLGIDLVPFKFCSYDCVYCQLGRTTNKTIIRQEYVPIKDILDELSQKLEEGVDPDYISLAGSGEPTLNSGIEDLILSIKKLTDIPVAVLTNGSLLWMKDVQRALMAADFVLPSLDAGNEQLFQYVNHPHKEISFIRMINGIRDFCRRFTGGVWLEVFLLAGVTGLPKEVKRIASIVEKISPERIQLNTVLRPPAMDFAISVPDDQMHEFAHAFKGIVDIISSGNDTSKEISGKYNTNDNEILSLLTRRPCTAMDVSKGLGIHLTEALKILNRLNSSGLINTVNNSGSTFYTPTKSSLTNSLTSADINDQSKDHHAQSFDTNFWNDIRDLELKFIIENLSGCKDILSIICGPTTIESQLSQNGFHVVSMDFSCEISKHNSQYERPVSVRTELIPLQDLLFDAVIYVTSLQFIEDIETAIIQTTNVLRPQGKLLVFLLNPTSELVSSRINDPNSYYHKIKHTNLMDIENLISDYFTVQSEYYLGIQGQRIFASNSKADSILYVVQGIKKPISRECIS